MARRSTAFRVRPVELQELKGRCPSCRRILLGVHLLIGRAGGHRPPSPCPLPSRMERVPKRR